jgi:hypothetical protein
MRLDPSTFTQGESAERTYIGHPVNAFFRRPNEFRNRSIDRTGTRPHADRDKLFEDFLTWMNVGAAK